MGRQAQRCKAVKASGERCGKWAMENQEVCDTHGGRAPQNRAAAERRAQEATAVAACAKFGLPIEVTPMQALLQQVRVAAGEVAFYRARVQELTPDQMVHGYTSAQRTRGVSGYGRGVDETTTLAQARPHVWVQLLHDSERHLADVCRYALAAGAQEQIVELLKAEAAVLVRALVAVLTRFGIDERDPRIPIVVPEIIQEITGEAL